MFKKKKVKLIYMMKLFLGTEIFLANISVIVPKGFFSMYV